MKRFAVVSLTRSVPPKAFAIFIHRDEAIDYLNTLPFKAGVFSCTVKVEFSKATKERIRINRM